MSLLRSIASGLRSLFRKEQVSQELDEELNGFLELAAEEKMKQGMSRNDALRAVRLERGNIEVTKEIVRAASWESFLETLWQDLRYAARGLRRNPGFATVAILSLALGVEGERQQESARMQVVSGEYFPMLGVNPILGRTLTPDDNQTLGEHPVAVISGSYWQRRFGGTPNILGQAIILNGAHLTIIGV